MEKIKDLMLMPSITIELPTHVVLHPPKHPSRFYFQVKRNRPEGFPSCIRLPIDSAFHDLPINDPSVLKAVKDDAKELTNRLILERLGRTQTRYPSKSLPDLFDEWSRALTQAEIERGLVTHWWALKPRTRRFYEDCRKNIVAWSQTLNHQHVSKYTPRMVREFLDSGAMKPSVAENTKATLSVLFSRAVEDLLIDFNPISKLAKTKSIHTSKSLIIDLWRPSDIDLYIQAALDINWIGGAVAVLGAWESMGRYYDFPLLTFNNIIEGNYLYYTTNKSSGKKYEVMAAMSDRFMLLIDLLKEKNKNRKVACTLLVPQRQDGVSQYREAIDDRQLGRDFKRLQDLVEKRGGRKLLARQIRHSAITHASSLGINNDTMRVNTSHQDGEMARTRYIQANKGTAIEIAKKRGIV